ncbi:MAG: hypothetical protein NTX45_04910 [Proteobacteria bacterium]|nr:hypothetical protein [Pseudomonadota bacterium]
MVQQFTNLAHKAWSIKYGLDTVEENSHAFHIPALLRTKSGSLKERAHAWQQKVAQAEADLAAIQIQIDAHAYRLYGLDEEDRLFIEENFGAGLLEDTGDIEQSEALDL